MNNALYLPYCSLSIICEIVAIQYRIIKPTDIGVNFFRTLSKSCNLRPDLTISKPGLSQKPQ